MFSRAAATIDVYTLSLHDALPICPGSSPASKGPHADHCAGPGPACFGCTERLEQRRSSLVNPQPPVMPSVAAQRSEEHTSELQSHSDLVCRLLLEKKTSCSTISAI